MRRILMVLSILAFPVLASANCGNGNGNGNGCNGGGTQGPAGPQGPSGPQGAQGQPGADGTNGYDGKDASAGFHGTDLAFDAAVRLLDLKYIQLQAYDTYIVGSDLFNDGYNQTIGARIIVKLGKSHEERLIERQQKEIDKLKQALLSK